jgi:hypothetical protein
MGILDKVSLALAKAKEKVQLQPSKLVDITIPLNPEQNLELTGCKVLTDTVHRKSILQDCQPKITSNKVKNPREFQNSVEYDLDD